VVPSVLPVPGVPPAPLPVVPIAVPPAPAAPPAPPAPLTAQADIIGAAIRAAANANAAAVVLAMVPFLTSGQPEAAGGGNAAACRMVVEEPRFQSGAATTTAIGNPPRSVPSGQVGSVNSNRSLLSRFIICRPRSSGGTAASVPAQPSGGISSDPPSIPAARRGTRTSTAASPALRTKPAACSCNGPRSSSGW